MGRTGDHDGQGPVEPHQEDAEDRLDAEFGAESDFGDSFLMEVAGADVRPTFRRLLPGERLGGSDGRRFEIIEGLGEGAMGQVFRAQDEELQRVVALKFLFPREELAGMGLREARAIARLDHENIVRIFDVSEWSGGPGEPTVPFLVMECLQGESLADVLKRERRLSLRRTLLIMGDVAAGLAHAHEHHIVHRDLKPSNVFITRQGTVKLLDFGLAWVASSGAASVPHLPTAGTPPYMAPEQWLGGNVDERTDIWAAGVLLYELLTGVLPYPNLLLEELRVKVLSSEPVPSPRVLVPELPWELESLLSVALAKDPEQRLLSAEELCEELRELEERFRPGRSAQRLVSPQRRQVTVVYCRVEGLTSLAEEMDPEDFGELEAAFHRSASEAIQHHGGFITLCMGDEVLACFGYPVAKEGDSESAVLAGLDLPGAVRAALRGRLPPGEHPALAVQVGIDTDMVVLDDILPELRGRTPTIQGEAPRIATWLARQAGRDEVVLGPSTYSLVQRAFDTESLGTRAVDGRRSLEVHRVLRSRAAVIRFERTLAGDGKLSPLVGREREMRVLLDAWTRAREGQGSYVLLTGEAGIGKSRLIQELSERVLPEKPYRLLLQCWNQFSTSALHPVIEMLQRLWVSPDRSPQENLAALERHLEKRGVTPVQVRLLASLVSLPVAEDSPHLRLAPQRQREETLAALATLLTHNATERPVLVVVEDLHWADPSTLQLLNFLLPLVVKGRLLFVLSARPEFRPACTEHPGCQTLVLERLPAHRTAQLVKEVARGQELPDEVVTQLVERADGIPLFVEEMTRVMLESGASAAIPVTLQELLLARLDSLPPRQKQLAQLCAVVGRSFSHALLVILTGFAGTALRRDLAGLVAAGLLQSRNEEAEPGYQFRHALIQEAAWQSLPRSTRRQYHLRIAQALVEHFPEQAEARPELLAHHYTEAGLVKQAIHYRKLAGTRASQRSANEEAVCHLTQALALLSRLPDAPALTQDELQLLIALGIPLVQVQGFQSSEVERTYTRVRTLLREVGDELPHLELTLWGVFAYYFARGKPQEAHEVGRLLVDLGGRQNSRELLSLGHRMLATDFFTWGQMTQALRHVELALEYSDFDLEQHRLLATRHWVNPRASALAYGSVILSVLGRGEEAQRFAREALELCGRIGHPHTTAFVLTYCTLGSQLRGDARMVLALADQCIPLAREQKFGLWYLWPSALKAWALAELGRPQEGLTLMRQVLELWKQSGLLAGMHLNLGILAHIHMRLGQVQEGLAAADEALTWPDVTEEYSYLPELHRVRGELLRLAGREEEARGEFLEAIRFAREHEMHAYEQRAQASLRHQSQALGLHEEASMHP
ncbi:protein kinase [Vitiosangium sp. GDMCC 1.1324]|uniref:protein kinase domain-containing protein n=1 Tax=Vitiosangium sp. (strain GDMCC 1.1324) TaxID=2138576 RepID=UPI000D34752F|nr:protein kinase [Vitiosangium sp. GDMCC 1.1324]PTL76701.1 protein kinase [Vitiosangium sp. GDMCC 1.1324]